MNKTRKGVTLVEVLVSIAVFAIISVAMISCLLSLSLTVTKQEEYVRFDMILSDMKFYLEKQEDDWENEYFGSNHSKEDNGKTTVYFTEDFKPTSNDKDKFYVMKYEYNDNDITNINIYVDTSQREIISGANIKNIKKEGGT